MLYLGVEMSLYLKDCLLELRVSPGQCIIDKSIFLYNHHFMFTTFHRLPCNLLEVCLDKRSVVHVVQKKQPSSYKLAFAVQVSRSFDKPFSQEPQHAGDI